jgi:hypothetical protein
MPASPRRPMHYCHECKRHVPCAPGITPDPHVTVGVAHVIQDPMSRAVPCRTQRTYQPDEQIANLDRLVFDDDVLRFQVSGDAGGDWTVDFSTEPPSLAHDVEAPCTFQMADRDLRDMLADPKVGMQRYFQGRLEIIGDTLLAARLDDVLGQLRRLPEIAHLVADQDRGVA